MDRSDHCGSVKRTKGLRGRKDMINEIINLTIKK